MRVALSRSERQAALALAAAELRGIANRLSKLDPDDRRGMTDAAEQVDIVQGSLLLLADDALTEEQLRERQGLAS